MSLEFGRIVPSTTYNTLVPVEKPPEPDEREGQHINSYGIQGIVEERLQKSEACDALGDIAHPGRKARVQQDQRDRNGVEKVPEDKPVAALKVGI